MRHLTEVLVAWGPTGIFLLAILDSTGMPVAAVFDVVLLLVASQRPEIAWLCASLAVIGSSIGNILLFLAARKGGRLYMARSTSEARATKFRNWFSRFGLITVFVPALVPIPLPMKLFVISAGVMCTPVPEFMVTIFVARILRYFGEAWLGVKLGTSSGAYLKTHTWQMIGFACALFATLFAWAVWKDRRNRIQLPTGSL